MCRAIALSRGARVAPFVAAFLLFLAASARAQGTARSMDIDASVISAGMGGASTAVFWGAEPNVWANPALLGYARGLRWQWGETRLLPGIASDVRFSVTRLTVGGGGIGLENAGAPYEAGGIELEYGSNQGTDINGIPTGTFASFESVEAAGVGISVGRLVEAIAAARGSEPPAIVRYVDVAGGWRRKDTVIRLAPVNGSAAASSRDAGLLVRLGSSPEAMPARGLRLSMDLTYAFAVLNYDDAEFVFVNEDQTSPPTRQHRHGVGMRIAAWQRERGWRDEGLGAFLVRGLDPWISLALAYDRVHATAGGRGSGYHQNLSGLEMTLANLVSVRAGRVSDDLGDFHHGSWGIGLNLPLGDVAAFRFDYASYPQPSLEDDLDRRSWSVWLDPLAAMRLSR